MIVVPSIHPAFLLRGGEDERNDARFGNTVRGDIARAAAYLKRKPSWNEDVIWRRHIIESRPWTMFPALTDLWDFCDHARRCDATVWIDVEATGETPMDCTLLCVGMGFTDPQGVERVICVPFLSQGGIPYWVKADENAARAMIADLVRDLRTGFQNGSYDTIVLWRHGMPVWKWSDDTMAAHHVVDAELPHGLAYLASVYTEIPYYKDSVKGDEAWIDKDDETLRLYNLRDVLCTMRAFPTLLAQMRHFHLEALYRAEVKQSLVMSGATVRGVEVDLQRRDDLGAKLRGEAAVALADLQTIAGDAFFKPGSPDQIRDLLYNPQKLGFSIPKRTDKGAPSTDKEAMMLLALLADTPQQKQALRSLIRWRKVTKLLSTFVDGLQILADNRVHAAWKCLTVTGRLASSPNMQNLPPKVKAIFRAGAGTRFVSVDLSQAELRVIAYLANDPDLLEAYEKGFNIHTVNCTLLFQIRNPGADSNSATEEYLEKVCPKYLGVQYAALPVAPKDKWKIMRRLAKNFVFGDNYGAMAETLHTTIRSQRDPETDDMIFGDLDLGTVEALKIGWEGLHPAIPRWWQKITALVNMQGHYRSPISGRIRWFRGGFKRNEILNTPIQEAVAAHMMRTNEIADEIAVETRGTAGINLQVHDMLNVETPEPHIPVVKKILSDVLSRPFRLPGLFPDSPTFDAAVLPPDDPTVGVYLNEV